MTQKISIITINYNNKAGLEKTIESVLNQDNKSFEYIVIDGGSKDGSKGLLEKYSDQISYWVSEPDKGIYNAMNKGIHAANGEYLLMLNSGDVLINNKIISEVLSQELLQDIIFGDVQWLEDGETSFTSFPDVLPYSFFTDLGRSLGHQSAFIKRDLHHKYSFYNENFRIISDWALFLLLICKYNVSYHHLKFPISICDRDGISCNPSFFPLIEKEKKEFLEQEFPAFIEDYKIKSYLQSRNNYLENRSFLQYLKSASKKAFKKIFK